MWWCNIDPYILMICFSAGNVMLITLNLVNNRFVITFRPPPGGPIDTNNCNFWMNICVCFSRSYLFFFFFFFRTTIKIIAKKRKNAPETVSYPLSNQFQRRLGTVDLFHRHVEVVHERDQNFTAHRHVNTLGPFLEPALHYVLKY